MEGRGITRSAQAEGAEDGGRPLHQAKGLPLGFTLALRWWGWPPSCKQGCAARPLTPVPQKKSACGAKARHALTQRQAMPAAADEMKLREGSLPDGRDYRPGTP